MLNNVACNWDKSWWIEFGDFAAIFFRFINLTSCRTQIDALFVGCIHPTKKIKTVTKFFCEAVEYEILTAGVLNLNQ